MALLRKEFVYSTDEFVHDVPSMHSGSKLSLTKFDITLRTLWEEAMKNSMFKYNLGAVETKILPGNKSYVLQRNILRGSMRRRPQEITSMNQPFNSKEFNFKKVREGEILMELRKKESAKDNSALSHGMLNGLKMGRNLLIINVSPLEYGHVLLVPGVDKNTPQRLDASAIKQAIEMLLLSSHPGFRLGFNSLCALASVNHQHVHAYYTEFEIYGEYVNGNSLYEGCSVYELDGMPCRGFGFQLCDGDVETLSQTAYQCVEYLQRNEIAHNLFFTRGVKFGHGRSSTERTVRLLLYPRKPIFGVKELTMFNTAVVELSGHIVVLVSDDYDKATEEDIDHQISSVSLGAEEFEGVKADFIQMLASS